MMDFFLAPNFLMWRMKLLKDQVQGLGVMKFFVSPVLGNFQQVLPLTAWVLSAFYAREGSPNYFLGFFLFCFDIGWLLEVFLIGQEIWGLVIVRAWKSVCGTSQVKCLSLVPWLGPPGVRGAPNRKTRDGSSYHWEDSVACPSKWVGYSSPYFIAGDFYVQRVGEIRILPSETCPLLNSQWISPQSYSFKGRQISSWANSAIGSLTKIRESVNSSHSNQEWAPPGVSQRSPLDPIILPNCVWENTIK